MTAEATRQGILDNWKELTERTMPGDAVVFYYSGHGALVKPDSSEDRDRTQSALVQFILPMDYDKTQTNDFKGILDAEMSHFLWQITAKTKNVTVILDCCHAGRMARNPKLGPHSSPKFLSAVPHHDIDMLLRRFFQDTPLDSNGYPGGNRFTVRIVAGTQGETAWEHEDQENKWHGALRKALVVSLEEAAGKSISWHTSMIRVRDILAEGGSPGHPNAEGPSKRIHFTLDERDPVEFSFRSRDGVVIIESGRVAGHFKDDVFAFLPHGSESPDAWVAKSKVSSVDGFESKADIIEVRSSEATLELGVAVLIGRALRTSPIETPPHMSGLLAAFESSKFVRASTSDEKERLPSVRLAGGLAVLYDEAGVEVFCSPSDQTRQITRAAEQLVRAKLFRNLRPEALEELEHKLEIQFDVVVAGQRRPISSNGQSYVSEGDVACIWLDNKGERTLFVNIFNINIAGKILLVNVDNPRGIEIRKRSTYVYGQNRQGEAEGATFSWPEGVPVSEAISESLVFIVTDKIANLQHVESPGMIGRGEAPKSTLRA